MPMSCTICEHPEYPAIQAALASGASLRTVEERFPGVSRSALSRHTQHREEEQPAEPSVSLCPPQDPAEHTRKRESLVHALSAAERQLTAVQEALAAHELVLARTLAVEAAGGFRPLTLDRDIDRSEPYRAWMARAQQARAQMDALLSQWREALRRLLGASNALTSSDHEWERYERRREFLMTATGQELEAEYVKIHEALRAAEAGNHPRLVQVYQADKERLQQRFLLAVPTARRVAA
jgi:hypothetical protein